MVGYLKEAAAAEQCLLGAEGEHRQLPGLQPAPGIVHSTADNTPHSYILVRL